MLFTEEFIGRVEENPIEGLVEACEMALTKRQNLDSTEWTEEEHKLLWEASSFVQLIQEINKIELDISIPEVSVEVGENCENLIVYLNSVADSLKAQATELKIASYKSTYSSILKTSFAYEFSEGDLNRVQLLLNEIRSQIATNNDLKDEHKQRLLKRLENLQSELHKRVSDLDRFWGLVGDAGVVIGKLGKDAKPIVDRIKEIAEIVWKTQARREELPSDSQNPMLEHEENS